MYIVCRLLANEASDSFARGKTIRIYEYIDILFLWHTISWPQLRCETLGILRKKWPNFLQIRATGTNEFLYISREITVWMLKEKYFW